MRDSFPAETRTAYLSGTVTPQIRATLRRLRLDFGASLHVYNDNHVIDGVNYQSDDYNDPVGQRVIWGDSCVGVDGTLFRLVTRAAWGGNSTLFRSGSDFVLHSTAAPTILAPYQRIGVYPGASAGVYRVWLFNSAQDLYLYEWNGTSWTALSTGLPISFAGAAVHPISGNEAIIVYYEDPDLFVRYVRHDTSWVDSGAWVVHSSDELIWSDTHWSDAVVNPANANEIVVAVNLSRWGTAHALTYNLVSGLWSQPREIMPSAEQWGNLRVWVSGLCVINGRIWATTVREPVASRDIQMAHHVALCSSPDGRNWRDEYYVSQSTLRGKLLYDGSSQFCYIVGNASVARAEATYRLGRDTLKLVMSQAYGLTVSNQGVGTAPEVTLVAKNDSAQVTGSGLLEADNELAVEIGAQGHPLGQYCRALLDAPRRLQAWTQDEVSLSAYGYLARVLGAGAYRPPAAKTYENPYVLYSNFNFEDRNGRLTVSQVSGTWVTERLAELGRYALFCRQAGISLAPNSMATQAFMARMAFRAKVSVEGNYLVFWYEDALNYWRAGLYNDAGTYKLVIDQVANGVIGDHKVAGAGLASVSCGNWYSLLVQGRPGKVEAYLRLSNDFQFGTPDSSVSYDLTDETSAPPNPYHVGIEVEGFEGFEGAEQLGTVTSIDEDESATTLIDSTKTFDNSVLGMWLRCNDQDRKVVDFSGSKLYIDPAWGEEPAAGDEWGLYTDATKDGPQMHAKELFVAEGRVAWTVDDITTNILELAGVGRSDVYQDTAVGTLAASSRTMRDVDLKLTHSLASSGVYFWCSNYSATGEAAFSGLKMSIGSAYATLSSIEGKGSAVAPYQVTTVEASHPYLLGLPGAGTAKAVRLQAYQDAIIVSAAGQFLTAFPVTEKQHVGGYVAKVNAGDTCTTTEFPEIADLIWDANSPAANALSRLLQGRRVKLVERSDGSVAVSRFDSPLGDLGTYTAPIVTLGTGERGQELVSLIEMVGAEERAFYLDPVAARKVLRYVQADNPTLWTQQDALVEAVRMTALGRQRASSGEAGLYAPDPALELEDQFQAQGSTYLVDMSTLAIQLDDDGTPEMQVQVAGRAAPAAANTTTYGAGAYDSGKEWG